MNRSHRGPYRRTRLGHESVSNHALANGTTVVLCPCPHLSQAHAVVLFAVGSRNESRSENGITHALEHMLFRGTASYPETTALNRAAEEVGGFLEGATYRDHLYFGTSCHPSNLDVAISLLGEIVTTPRYLGIEVERSILREELLETVDCDGRTIDLDNIAHRAVFGDHGLGMPIEGYLANVEAFTKTEFEAHRQRYLVGNNAVVSVAGPMDIGHTLALIERAFGGMAPGEAPVIEVPPPPKKDPVLRFVRDAWSQVEIRLSFRGLPIAHPSYPAQTMLSRVLGDGLASRMNAELVDRRGLAYSLHAGITRYHDCALFDFDVTVAPDRAADAVEAILGFAKAAGHFRYSDEEMYRARRRHDFSLEFRSDSVIDMALWHGTAALFGVQRYLDGLGDEIAKVDAQMLRETARQVFQRQGLVLAAAGELARGEWRRIRRLVADWQP